MKINGVEDPGNYKLEVACPICGEVTNYTEMSYAEYQQMADACCDNCVSAMTAQSEEFANSKSGESHG